MTESLEITLEEKMNLLADLKLRFIEEENKFKSETADLRESMLSLEEEIKKEVISLGKTVRAEYITATYNKGKETWNGKLLDGYAVAHPEILKLKRIGEPTISFRLRR